MPKHGLGREPFRPEAKMSQFMKELLIERYFGGAMASEGALSGKVKTSMFVKDC